MSHSVNPSLFRKVLLNRGKNKVELKMRINWSNSEHRFTIKFSVLFSGTPLPKWFLLCQNIFRHVFSDQYSVRACKCSFLLHFHQWKAWCNTRQGKFESTKNTFFSSNLLLPTSKRFVDGLLKRTVDFISGISLCKPSAIPAGLTAALKSPALAVSL